MTNLKEMIKAAKAVKKITKMTVTIKYDGYRHTLCIGHVSDKIQDRAYNASQKILGSAMGWGGNIEMAADISGHGVSIVATV